jgi:type IX secretion system PorP/SprF family membrane protein
MFSGSLPFHKKGFGIGFYFLNETIGPFTNQVFQISGAWKKKIKSNGAIFSVGAQLGLYNKVLDFGVLRPREPDPLIRSTGRLNSLGTLPDFAVGIGYNTKKYFAHLSAQQITQANFAYDGRDMAPLAMHFFLMGGYHFELSQSVKLSPMAIIKTETNLFSFEVGALATYKDWVWAGFFHRQSESVAFLSGLNLDKSKKIRLTYSFDFLIVNQAVRNATSAGSHEVVLSYRIPNFTLFERSPVRSPRFRLN